MPEDLLEHVPEARCSRIRASGIWLTCAIDGQEFAHSDVEENQRNQGDPVSDIGKQDF